MFFSLCHLRALSLYSVRALTFRQNLHLEPLSQPVDMDLLGDRLVSFSEQFIAGTLDLGKGVGGGGGNQTVATGLSDTSETRPYFLYLAATAPHPPLLPARRFQTRSPQAHAGIYGDTMAEIDSMVGRVLDAIEAADRARGSSTITFLTSDNGPWLTEMNAPWLYSGPGHPVYATGQLWPYAGGGKYTGFEGGHRMPTLVHWPGHIEPGVSGACTSAMDIMPTLATLTGMMLPPDRGYDGADLLPLLLANEGDVGSKAGVGAGTSMGRNGSDTLAVPPFARTSVPRAVQQHHGALVLHHMRNRVVILASRYCASRGY